MVKSRAYTGDEGVRYPLYKIGLGITKLLAPFFPHLTEEIYDRHYREGAKIKSIHLSEWPTPILHDEQAAKEGEIIKGIIQTVREWKSQHGIALSAPLEKIQVATPDPPVIEKGRVEILGATHVKELVVSKSKETKGAKIVEIL
jgi:valyl-tRNA synthetase